MKIDYGICEVLIKTNDKQWIKFESVNKIYVAEERERKLMPIFDDPVASIELREFTINIELGSVTKKRFIKRLMGKGIQRNCATEIAKYVLKKYGYYSEKFLLLF